MYIQSHVSTSALYTYTYIDKYVILKNAVITKSHIKKKM